MANSSKLLPTIEKHALRNKAKNELERLEKIFANQDLKQKIDKFKDDFSICEIVYKIILEDYQFKKSGKRSERMSITMSQVPYALSFAGYDYGKDLLTYLFGAEEKLGKRSVKKLRDSLNHSLNQRAIDELLSREKELYGYMNEFLDKIRQFDTEAK